MARRPLVAGNWKMNGLKASGGVLEKIVAGSRTLTKVDLMVCPPATLIASFAAVARGSRVAIGAQDCDPHEAGAYTGDISAEMLKDAGAAAVILGHSERRQHHGETDAEVRAKALAARRAGLAAIICVGETRAERDDGRALPVVRGQLEGSLPDGGNFAIAYEPVWAIGSGLTPTAADIAAMHDFIRDRLISRDPKTGPEIRILYGGSVRPGNARDVLTADDNVDGALVGGASLDADEFLAIASVF